MSSKAKKAKKKNENTKLKTTTEEVTEEQSSPEKTIPKFNYNTYFSHEEISEIKSILKVKDLSDVSLIIGATILNNLKLLQSLVYTGCNVNATGPGNATALIWAVKYKYMDIVDFLLSKAADASVKTDAGDNVLIIALEHKLWDEQSFLKLWTCLKENEDADVNFSSSGGHNILHMAVRRDWETLVALILMSEKVNIDTCNFNGVTPLMLACFRNNYTVVNMLLNAGASVLREDNNRRMCLCYAVSSSIKNTKPPFRIAERILSEMKKVLSFKEYLRGRLEILNSVTEKMETYYASTEMLVHIFQFAVQYTVNGLKILLELNVFQHLQKDIKKSSSCPEKVKLFLLLTMELLFFNEQTEHFTPEAQALLLEKFFCSAVPNLCLEKLKSEDKEVAMLAFFTLLLSCTSNEFGQKWLKEKYDLIYPFFDANFREPINFLQYDFGDEKRIKIMKKKLKKLKRLLNSSLKNPLMPDFLDFEEKLDSKEGRRSDRFISCSKKARRRSKAMKVKIAKIKNAELSERLSLTSRRVSDTKASETVSLETKDSYHDELLNDTLNLESPPYYKTFTYGPKTFEQENPIAASLLKFLENSEKVSHADDKPKNTWDPRCPVWKSQILNNHFADSRDLLNELRFDKENLGEAFKQMRNAAYGNNMASKNLNSLNIIVDYLSELLNIIIEKYQSLWERDKKFSYNSFYEINEMPWHNEETDSIKNLQKMERQCTEDLQKKFDHLIVCIKSLYHKSLLQCYNSLCKLESTLLNFKIRGKSLYKYISTTETIKVRYSLANNCQSEEENFIEKYIEDVLNDKIEPKVDVEIQIINGNITNSGITVNHEAPSELFYKELGIIGDSQPKDKQKAFEDKQKTLDHSYHLLYSIMDTCDSDEDKNCPTKSRMYTRIWYSKTTQNKTENLFGGCGEPEHYKIEPVIPPKWQPLFQKMTKQYFSLWENEAKRSSKEKDSEGFKEGNFNVVELVSASKQKPIVLKKILKKYLSCKVVKPLIAPLVSLEHDNILQYTQCELTTKEMILATPLCEWNISQFLDLLEEDPKFNIGLAKVNVVRQLLEGLQFLHHQKPPVVHGNLKPSNVFVDCHGIVKVAEFGIQKVLFKVNKAPESSMIWFSRETYQTFKESGLYECTLASDIQVTGMLIHYILTGRTHPFGDSINTILKNLETSIPKLRTTDLNLEDLLTWMLMYNPDDRPFVEHVISHVYFWTATKKWKFILTCAGVGNMTNMKIDNLHATLDKISSKKNIKSDWKDRIREKFPNLNFYEDETITGLLGFIRNFYSTRLKHNYSEPEFSKHILSSFPTFVLSLFRIIETTKWIGHPAIKPFTAMESS